MNARYFSARTAKTKRLRREDIARRRDELAELLKSDRGLPESDAKLMAAWDPFDQNAAASFFDPEWMFGLSSRFDLVIGNPPYISAGMIKDQKPNLKVAYGAFFDGNADLFTYFYKLGLESLTKGGVLVYISSNKFMRTGYGLKTRQLLSRKNELQTIIDFGELPVFGASVDSAIVVCNSPINEPKAGRFRAVTVKDKDDIPRVEEVIRDNGINLNVNELSDEGWLFESGSVRDLMKRFKSTEHRLSDIVHGQLYRGILTGYNDAFLLSAADASALIENCPEAREFILPWLDGAEIQRWKCNYSGQHLLAIASSANEVWPWSHEKSECAAEKIFSKVLPAIYQHLHDYRDRLNDRTDKGIFWWELRSCTYWDKFSQRKLVFNETSKEMHAFVDDKAFCVNKTGFIIVHDEVDFLCGILNSSALDYYYRQVFPAWGDPWKGGRIQFRRDRMVNVPVPWPERRVRDQVATLARAISRISCSSEASSNRLEQLLNGFVYELFFKDDLHARSHTLFAEAERAGLGKLTGLNGAELVKAAQEFADRVFQPSHPLYGMLYDLQALDVVRIIEGKA